MQPVNETQVGGQHYQSEFQHWDFVLQVLQGRYLEGCITKYITRHLKKNGQQDIQKSMHYLRKLMDTQRLYAPLGWTLANSEVMRNATRELLTLFKMSNGLGEREFRVVELIATWRGFSDLERAQEILAAIDEEYSRANAPS